MIGHNKINAIKAFLYEIETNPKTMKKNVSNMPRYRIIIVDVLIY